MVTISIVVFHPFLWKAKWMIRRSLRISSKRADSKILMPMFLQRHFPRIVLKNVRFSFVDDIFHFLSCGYVILWTINFFTLGLWKSWTCQYDFGRRVTGEQVTRIIYQVLGGTEWLPYAFSWSLVFLDEMKRSCKRWHARKHLKLRLFRFYCDYSQF